MRAFHCLLLACLVAALAGCEEKCESYGSASLDWHAERCPDGSDYELDCERVEGATDLACRCIRDGTVVREIERTEPAYGFDEDGVRAVNEACGWEIPPSP